MLEPIVATTRERVSLLQDRRRLLEESAASMPPARPFASALGAPGLSVIAEIKRRSPSRGVLDADLDPVERARAYEAGGAAALSVLTEPHHFSGSDADLTAARETVAIPVLRKDFIIDPLQVVEGRAMGADAILLIVAILDDAQLADLHGMAVAMGMDVLVEVHTESEAERAVAVAPMIVGVNNRDLATFDVDLATSERIAPLLEGVPVTVGESGIHGPDDARRMIDAGFDAVLVGESVVTSGDPASAIAELIGVAS